MHPLVTAYTLYMAQFDKEPAVNLLRPRSLDRAIWLARTIALSEWWNVLRRLPAGTR